MGWMQDGRWISETSFETDELGSFTRRPTTFRDRIGSEAFPAESGRYHLYVAEACPWAHRTLIFRALKGLEPHVSVDVVHPDMLEDGWTFRSGFPGTTGDSISGHAFLREVYLAADPNFTGRVTVPVLWDRKTGTIVSNESADIIRMFNSAFDHITGNRDDYWPEPLRAHIEAFNTRIYDTVNNGVYKAGFAASQEAYDEAVDALFASLDWLEDHLSHNRYLLGARITEADWRLFTTLLRFDAVYHTHFKCNRRQIAQYPALWAYARELYQWPGVAKTVNMEAIRRHYYFSHERINPTRIVPVGPDLDWMEPHRRARLAAA